MNDRSLKSISLEFEVKSTDLDRQTSEALREVVRLSPELQGIVEGTYPGVTVQIRRAEGLPVSELVQHLLVTIDLHAVASGAQKAIGAFVTRELLNLVKSRVRNLFAEPVSGARTATKKLAGVKQPKKRGASSGSTTVSRRKPK